MNKNSSVIESPSVQSQLFSFLLVILFVALTYSQTFSPWIHGVDSITRLTHIDKTIVVVLGNPWLPAFQLIMQGVHFFTDAPQAYKLVNLVLACAGMYFFLLISTSFIGLVPSLIASLYFFLHLQWAGVATSIYMEPLAMFAFMGSIYSFLRGYRWLGSGLFILATFSRPEFLVAFPGFLFGHYYAFKDLKRTVKFGCLFIPIIIYYIIVKLYLPSFDNPLSFNYEESQMLAMRLIEVFVYRWDFMIVGLLGTGGLWTLFFDKEFMLEYRRYIIASIIGLLIFYFIFVFILPLAHNFSPGGTRKALYFALPVSIMAGFFVRYLIDRFGRFAAYLAVILFIILVGFRFKTLDNRPPWSYLMAQKITEDLATENIRPGKMFYCVPDRAKGGRPVFSGHRYAINLHLRFLGWKISPIDCAPDARTWQNLSKSRKTPVVRLYRKPKVNKEYLELLTLHCKHFHLLKKGRNIMGDICY